MIHRGWGLSYDICIRVRQHIQKHFSLTALAVLITDSEIWLIKQSCYSYLNIFDNGLSFAAFILSIPSTSSKFKMGLGAVGIPVVF